MSKELKRIIVIIVFIIIGCIAGYFLALTEMERINDPSYIEFFKNNNMDVPEPVGYTQAMLSLGLLFSGIPTGFIFYNVISKKWLTPIAPKIFIGIITFPMYTVFGVICSIPYIIYLMYSIIRKRLK